MDRRTLAAKLYIEKISSFNSPGFSKSLNKDSLKLLAREALQQATTFNEEWHKLRQKEDEGRKAKMDARAARLEAESLELIRNVDEEIMGDYADYIPLETDYDFIAEKLS